MKKYFGNWDSAADVHDSFKDGYGKDATPIKDFPKDREVLFASYDTPCYEGFAFVLFERDGKLYEVHGSHCSCYGLEGQWTPEETTWQALAMRPVGDVYGLEDDGRAALKRLVDRKMKALA